MPYANIFTLVITAILAFVLTACDSSEQADTVSYSPIGPVPRVPQRPGDPVKGYEALLNAPYITCGIPYSAYKQTAPPPEPETLIPGRPGRNAELPYNLTAYTTPKGVELVVNNCLSCHAGFFDGKLVIGLGNENLDFTEDRTAVAESIGAYVENEAEAAEWRRWADRLRTITPYMKADTIGVNPAINITFALIAHRDPETLAWSPEPLIEPPPKTVAPVSVPPWWRVAKKNALFYNTEGRGDLARGMMAAALFCADDVDTVRKIDTYAPDILAYLASIKPPAWPFGVDHELAEQGRTVFERTCSGCHGTYGEQPSYPNLVVGLDEIGTDPVVAQYRTNGASDQFTQWFERSYYGELAVDAPAPGYIAPPLDGIWITAPYLHNGSVPTIEALLDSSKRPKYWTRSYGSSAADYDPVALGWRYTELAEGKGGAKDARERKKIYDTTLPGHSNAGHVFGDSLSPDERKAVLEYLKTL
ncbi:c-type cytochrome [Methylocaldum szegediense]|uniref:c-type cytochrome n=1 Tax=Methylocaldum szegediense TaxID=73780 RepID=UPI0004046834|nr:c-type cytochrome [Methylocaldum szegediense]